MTDWWQLNAAFPDPSTAELTGLRHLVPILDRSSAAWFLMRKRGAWRCRIPLHGGPKDWATTRQHVGGHLDGLVRAGLLSGWTHVVYEPETRAFGGPAAMAAAHTLFCADTRHLTRFLNGADRADRRREISLLLCHTLMRAADLDPFEQGDVWSRVAALRPVPLGTPVPDRLHGQVQRLLSVAPGPHAAHFSPGGAFAGFADWSQAFHRCGRTMAELTAQGHLERGLRAVLAHLLIFHWNRLAIPLPTQAVLARTAAQTVFDTESIGR